MRSTLGRGAATLVLVGLLAAVAACASPFSAGPGTPGSTGVNQSGGGSGGGATSTATTSGSTNPAAGPPSGSASGPDMKVTITDVSPAKDGDAQISVQVTQNGNAAQLPSGATLSCDKVGLSYASGSYTTRVREVAAGGNYTFTYIAGGKTSHFTVQAALLPVFIQPMPGSSVARGSNLTVVYVAGTGSGVAVAASQGSNKVGGSSYEQDDGMYTGLNVSSLGKGAGTMTMTRRQESDVSLSGFHNVHSVYYITVTMAVTWS